MITHFKITSAEEGKSILHFLTGRIRYMSPQRLDVAFFKGFIQINGAQAKGNELLFKGDQIEVDTTHFQKSKVFAEELPLEIVYEDEAILLIHKASGMACHAGLGVYHGTLLNALAWHYREKGIVGLENGLVHRLDRGTSGLMLCAKSKEAYQELSTQMLQGQIKRTYFAGSTKAVIPSEGVIDQPLKRASKHSFDISIDLTGKKAVTHYRYLEEKEGFHLYHCRTEFGRTHQVRIHMASIGAPLLGDTRYGGEASSRMHLCSASISFKHPIHGTAWQVRLDAPDF